MSDTTEKKILLTVNMKTEEAIKNMADAQAGIQKLRAENREMAKDYGKNSEAIAVNNIQIKNLSASIASSQKIALANTASVNGETGAYRKAELQLAVLNQKAKDMAFTYGSMDIRTVEASKSAKELSDKLKDVDTATGSNVRRVGDYKDEIIKAVKELTALKETTAEMEKEQKMLQSTNQTGTDEYKLLTKSIEDNQSKIKSLEGGTNGVIGSMSKMPGTLGQVGSGLQGMKEGFSATTKQMWLMVANPIGAIIAAIALALFGLYSVFKNFKPVVDAVEQSLAALGAIFDVLKNTVIALFTGQKSLTESTKGLGSAMAGAAKQAAELKKAQQELEDSQDGIDIKNKRDETQIQKLMLQSKNRTLSEQERIKLLDEAQKKSTEIFKRSKAQNDEEVKLAENKIIIGKNLTATEIKRLRTEGSAYARQLQDKRQISDDEIKTLTSALLKREDINQQDISIQEKAQNKKDTLEDAAIAKKEKAEEKAKQQQEKNRASVEKQQEKELKSLENIYNLKVKKQKDFNAELLTNDTYYTERIGMIESNWNDEKKIIDKELAYKKINAEEATLKYVDAEKKKNDSIKELNKSKLDTIVSSLQYELQLNKSKSDELIAMSKQTDFQKYENTLSTIKKEEEEKIKEQNAKLSSDSEYQSEHDRQVELIRQNGRTATAQANADWEEKERQRNKDIQTTNLNNQLAAVIDNIDLEFQLKAEKLEQERKQEIEAAKLTGESVALINAKYAKLDTDLDTEKFKAKFESIKKYADSIVGILSGANDLNKAIEAGQLQDAEDANTKKIADLDSRLKKGSISQKEHDKQVAASTADLDKKKAKITHDEAVREKELNVVKAIINTASAVVEALPNIPLSIAVGLAGALEIGTIVATPIPKASLGNVFKGNSHAQGGIPVEVEGDEMILTKGVYRNPALRQMASMINEMGGGIPLGSKSASTIFASGGTPKFTNDGGYTARKSNESSGISKEDIQDAMERAVAKINVRIAIEDIRKADQNYTDVQARGTF